MLFNKPWLPNWTPWKNNVFLFQHYAMGHGYVAMVEELTLLRLAAQLIHDL
jgi:hypothetical protein